MLEQSCDEDLELKKQTYDLASETITKFSSDEQESSHCFEWDDHVSSMTVSQHKMKSQRWKRHRNIEYGPLHTKCNCHRRRWRPPNLLTVTGDLPDVYLKLFKTLFKTYIYSPEFSLPLDPNKTSNINKGIVI